TALPFARRRLLLPLILAGVLEDFLGDDAGVSADRLLDLLRRRRVLLQISFGVLAPLPEPLAVEGKPRARFLHDARFHAKIDQFADLRYALAIHDVELDLLDRRRHLV